MTNVIMHIIARYYNKYRCFQSFLIKISPCFTLFGVGSVSVSPLHDLWTSIGKDSR